MRLTLAILFLAAVGLFIETAKAAPRWCAISHDGGTNCSFVSMEQCRATVSGVGGTCVPEAPVGHRQPRASDIPANVPKDEFDTRIDRLNRKLDRDLQFCRGC
jgi:hypothetical protein